MATTCSLLPMNNNSLPCLLVVVLLAVSLGAGSCSPTVHLVGGGGGYVDDSSSIDSATDDQMMERFQRWKVEYNRSYATASEERHRFQVYAGNMRYILARNGEDPSYELGETEYTDLTTDEFMAMYTTATLALDDGFDDDGDSNDGGDGDDDSDGDDGGDFDTVSGGHGGHGRRCVRRCVRRCIITGKRGVVGLGHRKRCVRRCRRRCYPVVKETITTGSGKTTVHGGGVFVNDEAALMNAVVAGRQQQEQPVVAVVAIRAGHPDFHHFRGQGVYRGRCGSRFNHAVAVVGYGEDAATGEKYWIVKNSWGTKWGDGGYIKLKRQQVPAAAGSPAAAAAGGYCGLAVRVRPPFVPTMTM